MLCVVLAEAVLSLRRAYIGEVKDDAPWVMQLFGGAHPSAGNDETRRTGRQHGTDRQHGSTYGERCHSVSSLTKQRQQPRRFDSTCDPVLTQEGYTRDGYRSGYQDNFRASEVETESQWSCLGADPSFAGTQTSHGSASSRERSRNRSDDRSPEFRAPLLSSGLLASGLSEQSPSPNMHNVSFRASSRSGARRGWHPGHAASSSAESARQPNLAPGSVLAWASGSFRQTPRRGTLREHQAATAPARMHVGGVLDLACRANAGCAPRDRLPADELV